MSAGAVQVEQVEQVEETTVTYESNTSLEELMLHNNCPIHMLLKCIPQFDDIVQLYYRCKVCQQAQVHAGIQTFLQHVKDEHGDFFQPQFEVVSDSDNVTMVVMPAPVKAEVVETVVSETQDDYHDNNINNTDPTQEPNFYNSNEIETEQVDGQSLREIKEETQQNMVETEPPNFDSEETNDAPEEKILPTTMEDEIIATTTNSSTSASENVVIMQDAIESSIVTASGEMIQEQDLTGATVIEMSTEEAEQVLIEAGSQAIKPEMFEASNNRNLVIEGDEVEVGGSTVQAYISSGEIGNHSEVISSTSGSGLDGVTQLVDIHGNQSMETQVIGNQAVEVQVVTPGGQSEYHVLSAPSANHDVTLEGLQAMKTGEVYQEEIQVSDLQYLQEEGGEQSEAIPGEGEDPNSLKYRRCKKCLKTFANNISLQRHYKETHLASPNWYVCPVPGCKYMAKRRSDIVGSHLPRRHKDVDIGKWKQDPSKVKKVHLPLTAEKVAENQQLIQQCMIKKKQPRVPRMAPDGNIYTCKECDLYFSNMKMLKRHHQTKHAEEILWMLCPVEGCSFTCKTKRHLLEIHIPRRHRDENLDYYRDNKEMIQKVYLPRGMKHLPEYEEQLYTDNADYLEEAKSLVKRQELANQYPLSDICTVTQEGFSCLVCQKTYKEKKKIRQHFKIFHSDPTARARPRRSNLPLESMASLPEGETNYEEANSLICRECQREYKSKHSLKRHYQDNHLDEVMWYVCPVEGCRYASKRYLDLLGSHCQRIHLGTDVTEYKKKPGLLQTMSMPPGEHPFVAAGRVKKRNYRIEEIADVYAVGDVATFKCKECDKEYHSRQALRQHFGENHAEFVTWYKCPIEGCHTRLKRRHEIVFLHLPKEHPEVDYSVWSENPNLIDYTRQPPEPDTSQTYPLPGQHGGSFPIEAVADMTVSNEDAGYKCSDCGGVFELKRELRQHYREVHLGTEMWYRCPVESCGFMSSRHTEMVESHLPVVHQDLDVLPWIKDPEMLERVQVQVESEPESDEDEEQTLPVNTKSDSFTESQEEIVQPATPQADTVEKVMESTTPSIDPEDSYLCKVCPRQFSNEKLLQQHCDAVHKDLGVTWYKCPIRGCEMIRMTPSDITGPHFEKCHREEDPSYWVENPGALDTVRLPHGISRMGEQLIKGHSKKMGPDTKLGTSPRVKRDMLSPLTSSIGSRLNKTSPKTPLSSQNTDQDDSQDLQIQSANGLHACSKCSREFKTASGLKRHMNNVHVSQQNTALQSTPASSIVWYKCPVEDCKFITNTTAGILKRHFPRAHSDLDITPYMDDPSLISTVQMALGIGMAKKEKEPKAKMGRPPKNKKRKIEPEEKDPDSDEIMEDQNENEIIEDQNTESEIPVQETNQPVEKRLKLFRCNECNIDYSTLEGIQKHCNLVHSGKLWYKCPIPSCKVVAELWGEIVGIHWILKHKGKEVAKFSTNPKPVKKIPDDSIVFNVNDGMEIINVKVE